MTKENKRHFRVAQFRGLGSSIERVKLNLDNAYNTREAFVGYHVNREKNSVRFLEGALLFDAKLHQGNWPPEIPEEFIGYQISFSWSSGGENICHSTAWYGSGEPTSLFASAEAGKGWNTWEAYKKTGRINSSSLKLIYG